MRLEAQLAQASAMPSGQAQRRERQVGDRGGRSRRTATIVAGAGTKRASAWAAPQVPADGMRGRRSRAAARRARPCRRAAPPRRRTDAQRRSRRSQARPADRPRRSARSGVAPRAPAAPRQRRRRRDRPARCEDRRTRAWAWASAMPGPDAERLRGASAASTARRRPSRPAITSGLSGGGAASPICRRNRSVGQVGR